MILKFLSEALLKVLNMSITASWVILVAIVLRFLLRKAPKAIVCFLWLFVAIRLICPFSVESVFSLIPVSEPISLDGIYPAEITVNVGHPNMENMNAPTVPVPAEPTQLVQMIFPILWAIGMVALLIYALTSYLRLRKKISMTIPYRDDIFLCDTIPSPFILGICFPKIYLPSGMTEHQISYALAHEQAHLSRKDHLWKPLGYLLLTLHWFNPLCWIGYMLFCKDIEFACDEKVIRSLAFEEKRAYSQTLLDCSANRYMIAACPLAFGEVDVKARIKSVLHYKKPAFWMVGGAVIACMISAVCLLTNPLSVQASNDISAEQSQQQAKPQALPLNQPKRLATESGQSTNQAAAAKAPTEWFWPTVSTDISLPYGEYVNSATGESFFIDHINIRGELGDDVFAAVDGQVVDTAVDLEHGYGQYIVISSGDGISTMYGHLDDVLVTSGSQVSAGEKIGTVGKTGTATSECLMFLVRDADGTVDPMKYYE